MTIRAFSLRCHLFDGGLYGFARPCGYTCSLLGAQRSIPASSWRIIRLSWLAASCSYPPVAIVALGATDASFSISAYSSMTTTSPHRYAARNGDRYLLKWLQWKSFKYLLTKILRLSYRYSFIKGPRKRGYHKAMHTLSRLRVSPRSNTWDWEPRLLKHSLISICNNFMFNRVLSRWDCGGLYTRSAFLKAGDDSSLLIFPCSFVSRS